MGVLQALFYDWFFSTYQIGRSIHARGVTGLERNASDEKEDI